MKYEYFWWGLEDSKFKGILYDSAGMYFLGDYSYESWEEFLDNDPHMAYAHLVGIRFNALEEQFFDLRIIPQMLGIKNVPLESSVRNINRYDWLKSIADLALLRFSSIRDLSFHFVNEVLELKIEDYKLTLKTFNSILRNSHPHLLSALKQIDKAGSTLRNNRNIRAHKGFIDIFTEDDQIFKTLSWAECFVQSEDNEDYDIVSVFNAAKDQLYGMFVVEVENALTITIEIADSLYESYRYTFEERSKVSKQGLRWSQHFQLHQKNG